MILDYEVSSCRRGSSPSAPTAYGTDEWVSGIRSLIGTAEEWLASKEQEAGTLSARTVSTSPVGQPPTHDDPGTISAVAA